MQQNIKKVAERGERLDSLQDKTGEAGHKPYEFLLCNKLNERVVFKIHWPCQRKGSEEAQIASAKLCGGRSVAQDHLVGKQS